MRNWLSVLFIALGVLVGYALRGPAVEAQVWLPFNPGERLVLVKEGSREQVRCTVTQVQHNFLGCKDRDDVMGRRADMWYNLQSIVEVRPAER
jgi:hypothetical protein